MIRAAAARAIAAAAGAARVPQLDVAVGAVQRAAQQLAHVVFGALRVARRLDVREELPRDQIADRLEGPRSRRSRRREPTAAAVSCGVSSCHSHLRGDEALPARPLIMCSSRPSAMRARVSAPSAPSPLSSPSVGPRCCSVPPAPSWWVRSTMEARLGAAAAFVVRRHHEGLHNTRQGPSDRRRRLLLHVRRVVFE